MINDIVDFGFELDTTGNDTVDTLFSGYVINFGVHFIVNYDRRFNPTEVKLNVIDVIKDFFRVEKMQFRQSINMNDLQYNILGLDGVIGIKELKLFQQGTDEYATGRELYYYRGDGEKYTANDSTYGFQYSFSEANEGSDEQENAKVQTIIRPSVTPAVFELKNPNKDIYGKVI